MENEIKDVAGMILRKLRMEKGLSLDDVSSRMGKSASWLSSVELAQTDTTLGNLERLLSVYGFTWERFLRLCAEYRRRDNGGNGLAFVRGCTMYADIVASDKWKTVEDANISGVRYEDPPRSLLKSLHISRMIVEPGETSASEQGNETEQLWFIISGKLIVNFFFESSEEPSFEQEVKEGDLVRLLPELRHSVQNLGECNAVLLIAREVPAMDNGHCIENGKPK